MVCTFPRFYRDVSFNGLIVKWTREGTDSGKVHFTYLRAIENAKCFYEARRVFVRIIGFAEESVG